MKVITKKKIIEILNCIEGVNIEGNRTSDNLVDYDIDSIKFIQMVVSLEDYFECTIPDDKLIFSEMNSIDKIFNILNNICKN